MLSETVSYVYVIGPVDGPVKIGMGQNPWSRLNELQTGNHMDLFLHGCLRAGSAGRAMKVEREVHRRLGDYRIRGEWFDIQIGDAILMVASVNLLSDQELGCNRRSPLVEAMFEDDLDGSL